MYFGRVFPDDKSAISCVDDGSKKGKKCKRGGQGIEECVCPLLPPGLTKPLCRACGGRLMSQRALRWALSGGPYFGMGWLHRLTECVSTEGWKCWLPHVSLRCRRKLCPNLFYLLSVDNKIFSRLFLSPINCSVSLLLNIMQIYVHLLLELLSFHNIYIAFIQWPRVHRAPDKFPFSRKV